MEFVLILIIFQPRKLWKCAHGMSCALSACDCVQMNDATFVECCEMIANCLSVYQKQPTRTPRLHLSWSVSRRTLHKMRPSTRAAQDLEPIMEDESLRTSFSNDDNDSSPFDRYHLSYSSSVIGISRYGLHFCTWIVTLEEVAWHCMVWTFGGRIHGLATPEITLKQDGLIFLCVHSKQNTDTTLKCLTSGYVLDCFKLISVFICMSKNMRMLMQFQTMWDLSEK